MKAPIAAVNSNVDDSMSSPEITSTAMSKGKLQASNSDSRPKYRPCDGLLLLNCITAVFCMEVLAFFTVGTQNDLAVLYDAGAYRYVYPGDKKECMPAGLPGLLYTSGYAQALPVLVLLAAWYQTYVAIHDGPARFSQRGFTLTSARRVRACRTLAVMLPCAALVALQPLVVISWAAFGGDMKRWEIDGRRYDEETHTWTGPNLEGGYECCASEFLPWGSRQTTFAQCSCIFGFMACAWYLLLGACFAVMPSKPRLLRAVFGRLPDNDGEDVAAAAADVCEERLYMTKDPDSVAKDPDSAAHVVDLPVKDSMTKTGAHEAS